MNFQLSRSFRVHNFNLFMSKHRWQVLIASTMSHGHFRVETRATMKGQGKQNEFYIIRK